jgi:hypothetical protein
MREGWDNNPWKRLNDVRIDRTACGSKEDFVAAFAKGKTESRKTDGLKDLLYNQAQPQPIFGSSVPGFDLQGSLV